MIKNEVERGKIKFMENMSLFPLSCCGVLAANEASFTDFPNPESGWSQVCEMYGREVDGATYYYSREVSRGILEETEEEGTYLEFKLVPRPYAIEPDEPDMILYVRGHNKGATLEIDLIPPDEWD